MGANKHWSVDFEGGIDYLEASMCYWVCFLGVNKHYSAVEGVNSYCSVGFVGVSMHCLGDRLIRILMMAFDNRNREHLNNLRHSTNFN